jgi:transcription antitermination factor NusG
MHLITSPAAPSIAPVGSFPAGPGNPWLAVQIRQTGRASCERMLDYAGIEFFSPCAIVERRWSDRVKRVEVPLFPGYLFCRIDPTRRLPILQIPGVLSIVSAGKAPLYVEAAELDAIRAALHANLPLTPVPYLAIGQKISITSGPLQGLEGILEQVKSRRRLLLSVTMLHRSVAVELDLDQTCPTGR